MDEVIRASPRKNLHGEGCRGHVFALQSSIWKGPLCEGLCRPSLVWSGLNSFACCTGELYSEHSIIMPSGITAILYLIHTQPKKEGRSGNRKGSGSCYYQDPGQREVWNGEVGNIIKGELGIDICHPCSATPSRDLGIPADLISHLVLLLINAKSAHNKTTHPWFDLMD